MTVLVCNVCKRKFRVKLSHASFRRTCSRKCAAKLMKLVNTGKGNPAYGVTYKTKENDPEWAEKISKSQKGVVNLGDKNGMKQEAAQKKVSASRKIYLSDPKVRKSLSESSKEAWASGKMDNVKVGRCHWYRYLSSKGKEYRVQGAWELAFVHWLCVNEIIFTCHRGRIPYIDVDGASRNWYPDFYVGVWKTWVDVKCDHFFVPEKFEAIRVSNPGISIRVLRLEDLTKLGVQIYASSSSYHPYLKDLIQRFRVQSGTEE